MYDTDYLHDSQGLGLEPNNLTRTNIRFFKNHHNSKEH